MNHITSGLPISQLKTPAFVFDEDVLERKLSGIQIFKTHSGCKVLYTLKALIIKEVLQRMSACLDGFSASSLFEAQIAAEVLEGRGTTHYTSPGLQADHFGLINDVCDYMSFNSLSQLSQHARKLSSQKNYGLRINPRKSYVDDPRYDPCRKNSRLGVPLEQLRGFLTQNSSALNSITGFHFHSNCDAISFAPLLETVRDIVENMKDVISQMQWINLGGGYLFDSISDKAPLYEAIDLLQKKYGLKVFIEPGSSLVRECGFVVASVVDMFTVGQVNIAVLDTTVNHMPEVFEYQFKPEIIEENPKGQYCYHIQGASCLAGDVFGEYSFACPLEIGSKITFNNMGAYTCVKAHMFNGINLPTLYLYSESRGLYEKKQYAYSDFLSRIGET